MVSKDRHIEFERIIQVTIDGMKLYQLFMASVEIAYELGRLIATFLSIVPLNIRDIIAPIWK